MRMEDFFIQIQTTELINVPPFHIAVSDLTGELL